MAPPALQHGVLYMPQHPQPAEERISHAPRCSGGSPKMSRGWGRGFPQYLAGADAPSPCSFWAAQRFIRYPGGEFGADVVTAEIRPGFVQREERLYLQRQILYRNYVSRGEGGNSLVPSHSSRAVHVGPRGAGAVGDPSKTRQVPLCFRGVPRPGCSSQQD